MALTSMFLCVSTVFLVLASYASALPEEMVNNRAFQLDLSLHRCNSERGPMSYGHEERLRRLDRKRVVFVGDSITRCVPVLALFSQMAELTSTDREVHGCTTIYALQCVTFAAVQVPVP